MRRVTGRSVLNWNAGHQLRNSFAHFPVSQPGAMLDARTAKKPIFMGFFSDCLVAARGFEAAFAEATAGQVGSRPF
jgi:hypothetical protein